MGMYVEYFLTTFAADTVVRRWIDGAAAAINVRHWIYHGASSTIVESMREREWSGREGDREMGSESVGKAEVIADEDGSNT
jgi:hypothetical protein